LKGREVSYFQQQQQQQQQQQEQQQVLIAKGFVFFIYYGARYDLAFLLPWPPGFMIRRMAAPAALNRFITVWATGRHWSVH
jgi:hypothetical protein